MSELFEGGVRSFLRLAKSKARELSMKPGDVLNSWENKVANDWVQYVQIHDVKETPEAVDHFLKDTYGFSYKDVASAMPSAGDDNQADTGKPKSNLPATTNNNRAVTIDNAGDDYPADNERYAVTNKPNRLKLLPRSKEQKSLNGPEEQPKFQTRGQQKRLPKPRYRVKAGSEHVTNEAIYGETLNALTLEEALKREGLLLEFDPHNRVEISDKFRGIFKAIARFILKDPNIVQATKSFKPGSELFNQYYQWLNSGHGKHSNFMNSHSVLTRQNNDSDYSFSGRNNNSSSSIYGSASDQTWKNIAAMISKETNMSKDKVDHTITTLASKPFNEIEKEVMQMSNSDTGKKILAAIVMAYKKQFHI